MSDHNNRENYLRKLLEDNFRASKNCRMIKEVVTDPSLKLYFQNLAASRGQFAIELGEEIVYFGGKQPYVPPKNFVQWPTASEENQQKYLKKALKIHNQSLENYKLALSQVNDGSCREILIRHKAFIEKSIFELKALKTLLKFRHEQHLSWDNTFKEY